MVEYPGGPDPPVPVPKAPLLEKDEKGKWKKVGTTTMKNGEGLNATPFEAEERLNMTFLLGKGTGWWYSFMFQLPKWGFETKNVKNEMEVSPAFAEYYAKTIEQKEKLEQKIKSGFASLSQAVSDFELIEHDLRKYQDILGFFIDLAVAERNLKKALNKKKKKSDEHDEEIMKAIDKVKEHNHIFRAMFVDQVDVHTGEGLSLRSIAPRWPTIIADFMKMEDDYGAEGEDELINVIAEDLKVAKAEAVILMTKNKLFRNWKSSFIEVVRERYKNLKWLAETRKRSIKEYRDQIRPLLSRYKSIKDMRSDKFATGALDRIRWYMPGTQAASADMTVIWAYRPYTAPDMFKASREMKSSVTLTEAGFNKEEIKILNENNITECAGLPILPIMDRILRCILYQIQDEYPDARITVKDIVEEANGLNQRYMYPKEPKAAGFEGVGGPRWIASPYYAFYEMEMERGVLKLPDGVTLEDMDGVMKATMISQNILLGRLLELRAMGQQVEAEISRLLGEEVTSMKGNIMGDVDVILKKDFPEIYDLENLEKKDKEEAKKEVTTFLDRLLKPIRRKEKDDDKDKKESPSVKDSVNKFRTSLGDFFNKVLGFELLWVYPGHYETLMYGRIARMYQLGAGRTFGMFRQWLQATSGVPGAGKPKGIPAQ